MLTTVQHSNTYLTKTVDTNIDPKERLNLEGIHAQHDRADTLLYDADGRGWPEKHPDLAPPADAFVTYMHT